jgi:hypothetical protein
MNIVGYDIPITKVLLGALLIWLAVAINYVPFNEEEGRFLQHHWWARVLIVFTTCIVAIDLDLKYHLYKRCILAALITAFYYLSVEV